MILVFGGQGQLGQELVARARANGVALTALGRKDADVTDPKAIAHAVVRVRPSLIVNAAGYNRVDKAETDRAAAQRANALGAGIVAAAAKRAGLPVVHISSDFVFDGKKIGLYREDDPIAPLNVYGRSKARGEESVRNTQPHHLILRTAWLYGAYGTNFLKKILQLAVDRDVIDVVGDQHGSPTSATDLSQAILIVAEAIDRRQAAWGTYHIAGTGWTSRHAFATAIVAAQAPFTKRNPTVNAVATSTLLAAAARPANSPLDSSKFAEAFGFRAVDWKTGAERTVAEIFARKAEA